MTEGAVEEKQLPAAGELPAIGELPDPFLFLDGMRVKSRGDWARRREEMKVLLNCYEYGRMPPPPGDLKVSTLSEETILDGSATERIALIEAGPGLALKIHVRIVIPRGTGPFPVVLKNDRLVGQIPVVREMVDRGYIAAEYVRHDLDRDDADRSDGVHPLYREYDWGTLAAWAWGSMRVVDYLLQLEEVDGDRIAVTGHSRGGKTALLAAALDERIAMAAPNGSGTGGAGVYRVLGDGAERMADILKNFPYWFCSRLQQFVGKEDRLPFDQHFLRALVAPRAVVSIDALGDRWANPIGTQHGYLASRPVFRWLGVPERNGIHFREGGHEQSREDWHTLLDFADRVFYGKESRRRFDDLPFPDEGSGFSWREPAYPQEPQ